MFDQSSLALLSKAIQAEARDLSNRLREGTIRGETAVSDRLVERLERVINGFRMDYSPPYSPGGYGAATGCVTLDASRVRFPSIKGRTLIAQGPNSEERLSGADIIIVYESSSPHIEAHKGILIQSKSHDSSQGKFTRTGSAELIRQCKDMRRITPHGFVFVYTEDGVFCFDAKEVTDAHANGFRASEAVEIGEFFELFLSCRIGDTAINAVDPKSFTKLVDRRKIRNGLHIAA